MLLSFTVGNFLSFKGLQTMDLTAGAVKDLKNNLHDADAFDPSLRLVKCLGILGHNNGGKSNLLKAYQFFLHQILSSTQGLKDSEPGSYFRLNVECSTKPSSFEMVIVLESTKYRYGFEIFQGGVIREWLHYSESGVRENHLFTRTVQETKINTQWNKATDNRVRQSLFFCKPNTLLLSLLIFQDSIFHVEKIGVWLKGNIVIEDLSDMRHLSRAARIFSHSYYEHLIMKFIGTADLGFGDIQYKSDVTAEAGAPPDQLPDLWEMKDAAATEILATHHLFDELYQRIGIMLFDLLRWESSGSVKYFVLSSYLAYAMRHGYLILVDELDTSFHVLVLRALFRLYNDPALNNKGSQLVFTTHNTTLLSSGLFRRDQFAVMEKNPYGESSIRKIHSKDNPLRGDLSLEKEYLKGRLGGVSKNLL